MVGAAVAFAVGMLIGMGGCATSADPLAPVPNPDGQLDLGSPGTQIATYEDVQFYPACGNETLAHDGKLWFPFRPANPEDFPDPSAKADADAAVSMRDGTASSPGTVSVAVGMVVPPGPGDDVGTLTVYEGGFAYWISDSGNLDTWLTTTTIEYLWMC